MMPTIQNALVVAEIGKPVTKSTRPVPKPNENEVLVKTITAGRKYGHILSPFEADIPVSKPP